MAPPILAYSPPICRAGGPPAVAGLTFLPVLASVPPMKPRWQTLLVLRALLMTACGFAPLASAAIIGTNPPALSLTTNRIAALPAAQQQAWKDYVAKSDRQFTAR